jgi:hypothetical protein
MRFVALARSSSTTSVTALTNALPISVIHICVQVMTLSIIALTVAESWWQKMVTTVSHKVIECDICKECKEFPITMAAPTGWEQIKFLLAGSTYLTVDVCPDCSDKVKKYIESIEQERY